MTRLFKKQQDSYKEPEPTHQTYISVLFNLDENYNVDIQFLWPDMDLVSHSTSKEIAKNYASLISIINLGGFKSDIIKILLDSQQNTQYESDKKFIQYILQYLVELEKIKSSSINNPIIMPTKVFNKKYD